MILPERTFSSHVKAPHRKRILASFTDARGVLFEVFENWPHTRWWAWARKDGWRSGDTITTGSKKLADTWVADVKAGRVAVAQHESLAGFMRVPGRRR